jgi:MFS family permease
LKEGVTAHESDDDSGYLHTYLNGWTLLSVATFLYWLASQSLRPYVPLHLTALGATEATVGIAIAAHPFLSLFLAIPAGRFIDLRGLRRFMMGSLAAMAVVGGLYASLEVVAQLVAVQALDGVTELGAWVGMQALITRTPGVTMRRRHLALFSIVWALGVAIGPTVGAYLYETIGFAAIGMLYSVCALVALVAVVALPYRDHGPAVDAGTRSKSMVSSGLRTAVGRIVGVSRRPGVAAALTASFVMLWANSLRTSFYPLFLQREGVPVRTIGYLVSLAGITLLISRFPLPILMRRFGSVAIMLAGTAAAVLSLVATPVLVSSTAALWMAAAVFGAGFGLNSPVTLDVIADSTEPEERGLAMGMRVASNRLAQVTQPLVFGAVAGALSMAAGFLVAGAILGGALAWAGIRFQSSGRPSGPRANH